VSGEESPLLDASAIKGPLHLAPAGQKHNGHQSQSTGGNSPRPRSSAEATRLPAEPLDEHNVARSPLGRHSAQAEPRVHHRLLARWALMEPDADEHGERETRMFLPLFSVSICKTTPFYSLAGAWGWFWAQLHALCLVWCGESRFHTFLARGQRFLSPHSGRGGYPSFFLCSPQDESFKSAVT
jgi:hypothetical protein